MSDAAHPATEPLPATARHVDDEMAAISRSFDWLKAVSPLGTHKLWDEFRAGGCRHEPRFRYPDLEIDIGATRERLLGLPIREIEHPVVEALLAEKQHELDRHLELMELRGTNGFMQVSIDLFGVATPDLHAEALHILDVVVPDEAGKAGLVDTGDIVAAAEAQFRHYRRRCPDFSAEVQISDDITAGMMVSKGKLLVTEDLRVPRDRLDALLHHEIGTHILTFHNGGHQPLKQLQFGLAHYDELQEGLGVLAEYLAGNLSAQRLRILAARVVAERLLTDGASFADVFDTLRSRHRFSGRAAFVITTRVFRGGGLTKDVVYLRGLRDLIAYLREGHCIEHLFIGKFSLSELPALRKLREERQLVPPTLLPSYLDDAGAQERLAACGEVPLDHLYQRMVA
ncbi:MAG TPA: tyrosine/phenylalanine carboxypeptidase domain-containing protein [Woeseiaceae bacterium]|nr:tyrosine/phenylalanine carboxypeptidase domain-containing protein [Woeseiaceae bacterium]